MKKASDVKQKQFMVAAIMVSAKKSNTAPDKEQHIAIKNLLAAGDEFSQSLMFFDIMVDTDTVKSLLIQDELRLKTLYDFYGVKLSDTAQKLLLNNLAQSKPARRANVLLHSGVQKERDALVKDLLDQDELRLKTSYDFYEVKESRDTAGIRLRNSLTQSIQTQRANGLFHSKAQKQQEPSPTAVSEQQLKTKTRG
jgi:hypothetical protein